MESFRTIFTHPLVWFYAAAYACTGAVRSSSDQIAILYFQDQMGFDMKTNIPAAARRTLELMPLVAVAGSFLAGWVSDRFFKGHRSPVAMSLYIIEAVVISIAAVVLLLGHVGPTAGAFFWDAQSWSSYHLLPTLLTPSLALPRRWISEERKWLDLQLA